jgi:plasmid stability protein
MTNLTIKVDDGVLRRARVKAAEEGRSLSAVVGEMLGDYVGPSPASEAIADFLALAAAANASSGPGGRTWTRDDLYDRKILR